MRLGLVTDVHNHSAQLARALALFRERGVDQILTIGDTCDAFGRGDGMEPVTALLDGCAAIGVWGNHDFSLCWESTAELRVRYSTDVLRVMSRMQPRLKIGECHFSHKESSVDPYDVAQLWDVSDRPLDLIERAGLAFAAVDSRLQFVGHYHRWWAATPAGKVAWTGAGPLRFDPDQRYFIVVAAVCEGWCALLDTDQQTLEPLNCEITRPECG